MWHSYTVPISLGKRFVKFTEALQHLKRTCPTFLTFIYLIFQSTSAKKSSKARSLKIVKKIVTRQCFKCQAYFANHSALSKHIPGCVFCPKCLRFRDYRHPPKCKGPPVYRHPRLFCTLCEKSYSDNRIARHMAKAHNQPGPWLLKDHPEVITVVNVWYSYTTLSFKCFCEWHIAKKERIKQNKLT